MTSDNAEHTAPSGRPSNEGDRIRLDVVGHIAYVTLNRPEVLNAVTPEMDEALAAAWHEVNETAEIRLAVLSGAGPRGFCAGADVRADKPAHRIAFGGGLTGVGGPLLELRKPLIAAVHGYCLGGGFELAMCADIIVAAEDTRFGMPEVRVGILGEAGIMHRAIRQLPHRVAMAMILTGEHLDAQASLRFGLVNEVVPSTDLHDATDRWASKVLEASPLAQQAAKAAVLSRLGHPLEEALSTRFEGIEAYAQSDDVAEGAAAWAERRKPRWTGR